MVSMHLYVGIDIWTLYSVLHVLLKRYDCLFAYNQPLLFIQTDPELAQVVLGEDLNKLQELLRARNSQRAELQRQQEEELVSSLSVCFLHSVG